ncbi:hypothetical protein Taro_004384 [Colocasia esculenta]|uniref:Uncharacterized protein n=1 Tax=Colocasia esculenta TaxID=4460 RepID=A0A843TRH9_COLES|nr:hypothetical protein [Colocasia esculenta]
MEVESRRGTSPLWLGRGGLHYQKFDLQGFLERQGQTFSCKGSVDTTINGVDIMAQSKGRNVKKRSTSVDTSPGQVDTRDRSQRNMLTGFHLRSTLNQIVVCEPSSSVVYESSYSLCGLSHRAQFGVVILRLLFEPSCSIWSRLTPVVV